MTLTINDTTMTSDQSAHTARQAPGQQGGWQVSWLPGQTLDRNTAITAMIFADLAAGEDLRDGHRLWPHIQGWAAEVGLTAPRAVAAASQPLGVSELWIPEESAYEIGEFLETAERADGLRLEVLGAHDDAATDPVVLHVVPDPFRAPSRAGGDTVT